MILATKSRSILAIVALACCRLYAGTKEDSARELLQKSFQQANIWGEGPVDLVAEVKMPRPKGQDVNLRYEISWAGPDKWRAEWSGAKYSRIIVVNEGKQYRFSSTPVPPLPLLQFEQALGALTGNGFGGPFFAPWDLSGDKIRVTSEKVGKTDAKCVSVSGRIPGEVCIDPVSARALSFEEAPANVEYNDYASVGQAQFPQTVRLMIGREIQEDAKVTVTRDAKFADSLFTAPANSSASDFPVCGDKQDSTAPHLDKKVQPEYPENARTKRHQGTVWLYTIIAQDGSVQSLRSMSAPWPELERAAIDVVKEWKYTPYVRCGKPIEYEAIISVNYSLSAF